MPKPGRRRLPVVVIGGVVVAAAVVTAVVLGSGSSKPKASPATGPRIDPTFTAFNDQKDHFSLSYPPTWTMDASTDPTVPLQLSFGAGGLDTLKIRVQPTQDLIDSNNVATVKAFTDGIISGTGVTVLKQQPVTVNGLPGYYYFYTLPTVAGVTLVHSRIFIFPPHEMVSLIFQSTQHDFSGLANSFDQVVSTFHTI